jgi:hypothetical protein
VLCGFASILPLLLIQQIHSPRKSASTTFDARDSIIEIAGCRADDGFVKISVAFSTCPNPEDYHRLTD